MRNPNQTEIVEFKNQEEKIEQAELFGSKFSFRTLDTKTSMLMYHIVRFDSLLGAVILRATSMPDYIRTEYFQPEHRKELREKFTEVLPKVSVSNEEVFGKDGDITEYELALRLKNIFGLWEGT